MSNRETIVVLLSGGINSAAAATQVVPLEDAHLLYIDHGHAAAAAESKCVRAIAQGFAARLHIVKMPSIAELTAGHGTGATDILPDASDRGSAPKDMRPPGLMSAMIGVAQQLASQIKAETIVCGASQLCNETDRATDRGQGDLDARQVFFHAAATAIQLSSPPKRRIVLDTPFMQMSRPDIVRAGLRNGTPFHLTWSCYLGGAEPCSACAGCKSRTAAFDAVGMVDPILEHAR